MTTPILATLAAAYLLGSLPFSYLVARLFGVQDVRTVGSGNVGATNVMRSAGWTAGALALVLDASKGAAAALCARSLYPADPPLPALAALGAVVGHLYPVWLGFRGGKGVATGAGAFLPLAPLATGASCLVFLGVAAATRYVSLGSVAGAATLAGLAFVTGVPSVTAGATACVAALVIWKHRGNLARIAAGSERRLGKP
jgi:glycerol-3-phosphate acyltransferase PlsY